MSIAFLLAAQAIGLSDLRPNGFYLAGIQQGMTMAEYNALISNGGYKSQPIQPDAYLADINGQTVSVAFCQGRIFRAIGDYRSTDWLLSMKTLEALGFKWGAPLVQVDPPEGVLRMGSLAFAVTKPKGFNYYVAPMIKGATANGRDLPAFQLMFEAENHACR